MRQTLGNSERARSCRRGIWSTAGRRLGVGRGEERRLGRVGKVVLVPRPEPQLPFAAVQR